MKALELLEMIILALILMTLPVGMLLGAGWLIGQLLGAL
jgi:hypothetical protein